MKSVYILLTKSNTYFSKFIHHMTADEFTHSSISLDRDLRRVYSFGRLNPRLIWPAGFIKEDVRAGLFKDSENNNCCLFELMVSDETYNRIQFEIEAMEKEADKYRYSLAGAVYCKMNKEYHKEYKYFCSEFVSEILAKSGALNLPKATSLMRPIDFCGIDDLNMLYRGELKYCIQ